jgi:basic membrane lipoprotein Med (substrate-binding protein (PBP1-ABC) superfamily)
VASAIWHFEPTLDAAIAAVQAGSFTAKDYGIYSFMAKGGCSLAPYGTFEGKIPQAALDLIATRTAAIKDGSYTVAINDEEPKSS